MTPVAASAGHPAVSAAIRATEGTGVRTAFGTVVVHTTPESAANGPLAAVRNGDLIELDVPNRRLDLKVEDREVQRRLAGSSNGTHVAARGYGRLFAQHVLQADKGCDFDFLRAESLA